MGHTPVRRPKSNGPETTRRSHVILALDVLCPGHMKLQGSSRPRNGRNRENPWVITRHAEEACRGGLHDVSKMFVPVRLPYFQWLKIEHEQFSYMVFLRLCADRRPVCRLAGAVLVPTGQTAHNQVLPGKYNTKVH